MMRIIAMLLAVAALDACGSDRNPLLVAPRDEPTPLSIVRACDLTRTRCSRCHSVDRIVNTNASLDDWRTYVRRMRLMPSSAIRTDEEPIILSCLAYRIDAVRKVP